MRGLDANAAFWRFEVMLTHPKVALTLSLKVPILEQGFVLEWQPLIPRPCKTCLNIDRVPAASRSWQAYALVDPVLFLTIQTIFSAEGDSLGVIPDLGEVTTPPDNLLNKCLLCFAQRNYHLLRGQKLRAFGLGKVKDI